MKNSEENKRLVPVLRFPEFVNDGEWEVLLLEDGFDFISTNTLTRSQLNNKGGEFQNVHYGDVLIKYGSIIDAQEDSIPYVNEDVNCQKYSTLNDGDVIIADTAEDEAAGKACEIRSIENKKILSGLHTFCLRPTDTFAPKYLGYWFNTNQYHCQLLRLMQGAKVCSISKKALSDTKILRPTSTGEQQKIADCLSSLDKCIQATKGKVESLKEYKRGLMQKLFPVRGKSTPEFRFPEFTNNGVWLSDEMQEIFEIKNGYTPSKSNPTFWENGTLPWFRMEDIRKNGHILSDSIQHITPEAVKGSGLFPAYSIIVATTATIGEHALIIVDSLANQQFTFCQKRKSFENRMDMMYFHYYMFIIDEWCKQNTNSGGLLSVNMAAFKKLSVPYPATIQEQQKIADILSSLDKQIDSYSEKISLLEEHKKGLMQQLFPHKH